MSKIGFIGAGNMGGALARAVAKSGHEIALSDAMRGKAEALAAELGNCAKACDTAALVAECDMIFLGVKPAMLSGLAQEILPLLAARKRRVVLTSMAAGVSVATLESLFGGADQPILRIMPNTPASVGEGMILYCKNASAADADVALLLDALSHAGKLDALDEKLIDAASAVSGCGPAFVCLFLEALADGGVRCGLPRDKAMKYATQTLLGTAKLAEVTGKHPGELKDAVCSPGGTTIEGVAALEDGAFRAACINAVTAAYNKTIGK